MEGSKREAKETGSSQLVKEHNQVSNKVKLCGYLKKKRNKVGGWRKMWFVLQDKLLLSYGSKEEYDNKLVSFKDVLNLVPGTLVRPLGGFRFTIETASHAMYTFHCDDRVAYREWITVLLDSLTTQPSSPAVQKFCHISVDNIPSALSSSSVNLASSFDCIAQPQPKQRQVERVRLPIAYSTARLLERNGMNSNEFEVATARKGKEVLPRREELHKNRHFFLHHNVGHSFEQCVASELKNQQIHRMFLDVKEVPRHSDFTSTSGKGLYLNSSQEGREEEEATRESWGNSGSRDSKTLDMVKDRIQCLSIRGSREFTLDEGAGAVEQHNYSKLLTTSTVEQVILKKGLSSGCNPSTEPVYAVVDLKNKYAQRKKRNCNSEFKRCNSYDSIAPNAAETPGKRAENALSVSVEDINDIYEDGDKFFLNGFKTIAPATAEDENIYEPINVATTEASTFWKYFTRLKVNSFLHLTRIRKRSPCPQPDRESQFSNIKHKFGMHRKSMQVRVRKLCSYEPKPFFKQGSVPNVVADNSNANCNSASKKSKSRWKSVKMRPKYIGVFNSDTKGEKRFFGSLPHLRKARTSLFTSNHLHHLPLENTDNDSPDPDGVNTEKSNPKEPQD